MQDMLAKNCKCITKKNLKRGEGFMKGCFAAFSSLKVNVSWTLRGCRTFYCVKTGAIIKPKLF